MNPDILAPAGAHAEGSGRVSNPIAGGSDLCIGDYFARLATSQAEVRAAQRLRFEVFNLELNEGLEAAYRSGVDRDLFDDVCDHIIVEHGPDSHVVGTYRVQTGSCASRNLGYYSQIEFDFTPFEPLRAQMLELGRACIHKDHRSFEVLTLLWRAVAQYAVKHGSRYLVGCSSLTSQDPEFGAAMYQRLQPYLVDVAQQTMPQPDYAFPLDHFCEKLPEPPRLLRAYLAIGAGICGPPAIDREFKTIDFLTLLDLERLTSAARMRFLGE